MKHKKIVFVCTGNTCRSPMAEAALRHELKRRRIRWFTVLSAGLRAGEGQPMTAEAEQALREAKIAVPENFASRPLTKKIVEEAHLVICMTEQHRAAIASPNVTSFYQLAGREIPDPYGLGIDAYRVTLRRIRECLPCVIAAIRPPEGEEKEEV